MTTQATLTAKAAASSSSARRRPAHREPIAAHQADVALCDMRDIMAMTRLGKSFVYAAVKAGTFPAPVIQQPRCTRWRLADVRQYLIDLANRKA